MPNSSGSTRLRSQEPGIEIHMSFNSGPAAARLAARALRIARGEAMSRQQEGALGMRLSAHPAAREALSDTLSSS